MLRAGPNTETGAVCMRGRKQRGTTYTSSSTEEHIAAPRNPTWNPGNLGLRGLEGKMRPWEDHGETLLRPLKLDSSTDKRQPMEDGGISHHPAPRSCPRITASRREPWAEKHAPVSLTPRETGVCRRESSSLGTVACMRVLRRNPGRPPSPRRHSRLGRDIAG